MINDVIRFNRLVDEIGGKVAELADFGREGFHIPATTTPEELEVMVGLPMGPWRPRSSNLIWFHALKTTIFARQMLRECQRIFEQIEDKASAQKIQAIIDGLDEQFHPAETAMQVFVKLLNSHNGHRH